MNKLNIFISYARKDKEYLDEIVKQFSPFERSGAVTLWYDDKIEPGSRWSEEIEQAIRDADIFVMLVSEEYIHSEYCFDKEANLAKALHDDGKLAIVPVYIRSVALEKLWISDLQILPSLKEPVASVADRSATLKDICTRIAEMDVHGQSAAKVIDEDDSIQLDVCKPRFQRQELSSALERYDSFLDALFRHLSELQKTERDSANRIRAGYLRAISRAVDGGFFAAYDRETIIPMDGGMASTERFQKMKSLFDSALLHERKVFSLDQGSRLVLATEQDEAVELFVFPFSTDPRRGMVVLCDEGDAPALDEVLFFTFKEIHNLSNGFTEVVSMDTLKSGVFDLLKMRYRYVSEHVYEERFRLFKASLQEIHMHFEPIYHFDKLQQSAHIHGWEALARIGSSNRAPVDILMTAELWGTRFKTELDVYVLKNAVATYKERSREIELGRAEEIRPLSINIYPESLFRKVYHDTMETILVKEKLIPGSKLILEVSEKSIINEEDDQATSKDTLGKFLEHMEALREKYNISFAIDDFGAGYSSITRLDRLKPNWVKIDREVLHCEAQFAKALIKNLLNIKTNWRQNAFKLIIEGLDSESDISLDELVNEVGVKYIQGHLLGKANAKLTRRPDRNHNEKIKACAGWY